MCIELTFNTAVFHILGGCCCTAVWCRRRPGGGSTVGGQRTATADQVETAQEGLQQWSVHADVLVRPDVDVNVGQNC